MKESIIFLNIIFSLLFLHIFFVSKGIAKKKKSNACESFINNKTLRTTSTSWQCSIIGTQRQKIKRPIGKLRKNFRANNNSKTNLVCVCSLPQTCVDNEEFYLESDLVDASEYAKLKFAMGNNFYSKQCTQGLEGLTDKKDKWKCELQYDRLHRNEFYCNCRREIVCQNQKIIKIKTF